MLNALLQKEKKRRTLGVVSIGVDGEAHDAWSGRAKPKVIVPENCIVATAGRYLDEQPGAWELISDLELQTVLGTVFLARAKKTTQVQLAGVPTLEGLRRVLHEMEEMQVSLTLVDGAYDRRTLASPAITDAAFLVVGASLAPSLREVLHKAEEWLMRCRLPKCEEESWQTLMIQAMEHGTWLGRKKDGEITAISATSSDWQQEHWEAIAIPGAVTDRLLSRIAGCPSAPAILLPDFTRLFASLSLMKKFLRQGGRIEVLYPLRLLGVAINPESPDGYWFDPEEMMTKMARLVHPLPVGDVVRNLWRGGEACL